MHQGTKYVIFFRSLHNKQVTDFDQKEWSKGRSGLGTNL